MSDTKGAKKAGGVNPVMIVAGLVVLLVAGFGVTQLLSSGPTPEEEAAAIAEAAQPIAVERTSAIVDLGPQFCANPGAIADAPAPDQAGINVFASYYKFGTTEWRDLANPAYDVSYLNATAEINNVDTVPADTDPAYVSCVEGIPDGNDVTCRIYEGAARHIISGADYSVKVYQLSTGEEVVSGPVRTGQADCPAVVVGQVSYSEYLPRQHDLAMWTADLALPAQFTSVHLDRQAMGGSPEWCQSPSAIDTGVTATATGVKLMLPDEIAFNFDEVNWETQKMSELSHIACVRFAPTGDTHECDYDGNNKLKRPQGFFEATIVNPLTGEELARQSFDSVGGCTALVIFNRQGQTKNEPAQPSNELYDWLNEQNPFPPAVPEDGLGGIAE